MAHLPNHRHLIMAAALTALVPVVAAGSATSAASTGAATAAEKAPPPPVVELLSRGAVDKRFDAESSGIELETDGPIDVAVARLTFAPGSATGWHRHTGPVLATITAGRLTLIGRHCTRHTYKVGDTFIEKGGRVRSRARNTGKVTTKTIVTFLLPPSDPPFTPATPPACAR